MSAVSTPSSAGILWDNVRTSLDNVQHYSGKHLAEVAGKSLAAGALTFFLAPVFAAIAAFSFYSKGKAPTLADIKARFAEADSFQDKGAVWIDVAGKVVDAFLDLHKDEKFKAIFVSVTTGIISSALSIPLALVAAAGTAIYYTQDKADSEQDGIIASLRQKVQDITRAFTTPTPS